MPATLLIGVCFFAMVVAGVLGLLGFLTRRFDEDESHTQKSIALIASYIFIALTTWMSINSNPPIEKYKVRSFMHEGSDYILLKDNEWINLNEKLKKDVETDTVFLVTQWGHKGGIDWSGSREYTEFKEEEEQEIPFFEGKRD